MTKERIEKAVEIINYAIENKISVKEASKQNGFADTYVKNIKAIVYDKFDNDLIEDELFRLFNEAYENYLSSRSSDNNEIFSEFITDKNIINLEDNASISIFNPITNDGKTTFKVDETGDEATIEWTSGSNYPENHIKTLEELLEATEVDLNVWKVRDYSVNKWDVTMSPKNLGYPVTIQNYQVKARLDKKIEEVRERMLGEIFKEMTKNYEAPVLKVKTSDSADEKNPLSNIIEKNLIEVNISDLHFGKLCWSKETGENYDTKIATERFFNVLYTLLDRASSFNFDRILFPIGNDFFNSDTIYNTTTKGTAVDEDSRWAKSYANGCKLLVDGINILKQTGVPIDVLVIPGNHDLERSHYMGSYLEAWFHNDPQVIINNSPMSRKYYRYGEVLLGFTHGSEEKESSLPLLMASDIESKPHWSQTSIHEFHLGHFHKRKNVNYSVIDSKSVTLNDELGVTIRYMSSITGTDQWHHKSGFIGATKGADAYVWNYDSGLIANLVANLVL